MRLGSWMRRPSTWVGRLLSHLDRLAQSTVRRSLRFMAKRLGPITLVALTAAMVFAVVYWDWLQTDPPDMESGSSTIRNLSLVIAALVALPLAIWRSLVSQRQADAAHRQAQTAQKNLLNERYQKGAEMIGSEILTIRLGGIYALDTLAKEHIQQYHIQITQLLCAFVRHSPLSSQSTSRSHDRGLPTLADDVQATMLAIANRRQDQIKNETDALYRLNFENANLSGLALFNAKLSHADLAHATLESSRLAFADLSDANLWNANLSSALLWFANLSSARLAGSDLSGTQLMGANLSGTDFSSDGNVPPTGLTQKQLDEAHADPSDPPQLEGLFDPGTGEPLEWRGEPLNDHL